MFRALLALALMLSPVAAAADPAADPGPLRWSPPPLAAPKVILVPREFFSASYAPDEDVVLVLPGQTGPDGRANPETGPRVSDLEVRGGRNIRLVGGENGPGRMAFRDVTGSVFLEGVSFALTEPKDAINAGGREGAVETRPDVYLQNIFATGVRGSFDGVHADIFQPQGPVGRILVDRLSGGSAYQGLFLAPQRPIAAAVLSRLDLRHEGDDDGGDTYLLWLAEAGRPSYPITLEDVWVKPRPGRFLAEDALWPPRRLGRLGARPVPSERKVCWAPETGISGCVNEGTPPDGRFAPPTIGRDYRSPGYQAP